MRVIVCGSRSWADQHAVRLRLMTLPQDAVVIHGGARGADDIAALTARDYGLRVEAHPADWVRHGRRAGIVRNLEMLDSGADIVIAFWDGKSRGTKHTVDEAEKRGIPVEVIRP